MLANSLFQINTPDEQGFLYLKNKSKLNYMKKLYTLFILMLLVLSTPKLFSQNIDVYPVYPPTAICDGDQVTLIITTSILPTGKTLAYYKFWADSIQLPYGKFMGNHTASSGIPQQYQFLGIPPGVYNATGIAVATDSSHYSAGTISYTVYQLPKADFTLTSNSLDTQCFNGNQFCFVNTSIQNPLSPSNKIASCYWLFGDGEFDNNCSPIVCHHYGFVNQFFPILTITDDHGCKSMKMNPSGHDSLGVVVVNSATPNFSWIQTSGYCFQTCYRFKNLSPLAIDKVNHYQWDFGDKQLCDNWWEPDSNTYTGQRPFLMTKCDTTVGKFDSAHFDTITHCYCEGGIFKPKLSITNVWGCTDSLRKTPSNSGGKPIPANINFKFDVTSTTSSPNGTILADSVCVGSGNSGSICYKQTEILGVQPGGMGQGFKWDFGDPADPTNRNFDSMSWQPCHAYSGMGSFFPSFTVQCHPDTTFYYYSAKVVGPYHRFIDTTYDSQRDLLDATKVTSTVPGRQIVRYTNKVPVGPALLPTDPAFDGQAMIINAIDSVQMRYVGHVANFAKYKMVFKNKYIGDTAYYFDTLNFTSPYSPYPIIRPDSVPVYQYWGFAPRTLTNAVLTNFFIPPPIAQTFQTIRDSIVPLSFPTGFKDVQADSCLNILGLRTKPYYYNTIVDSTGKALSTFWYKFARSYNYGVRVLGPFARIENPPAQILIKTSQKQQCGPNDTVDFVNTSLNYKSRNVWRRWDFGDVYAPQCTSFSIPHFPHAGMYSWPPVVKIDSFAYYKPISNTNDYLSLHDTLLIMHDTTRMWSDAVQQFMHSDHFFISNGVTYQGRRNCNYSHDTLPRHVYPNWDTVYLWYRYGHDFMPWNSALPGNFWTKNGSPGTNGTSPYAVKDWDTTWWGKPIYLDILSGNWSKWQDSSFVTHYVDTTYVCNYFTFTDSATIANLIALGSYQSIAGTYGSYTNRNHLGKQHFYFSNTPASNCQKKYIERDTLPGKWVKWPRIDTLNQSLPRANQLPRDLLPGNAPNGITPGAAQIPDPFQMALGNYTLFSGISIDTAVHFPPLTYTAGKSIVLPPGTTKLPGSNQDFFEYMFRRVIQKCITVTLLLTDSLNNESRTASNRNPSYFNDGDTLDAWDCTMQSTVILALGKPDARGMGKQPKECPGLNGQGTQGYPALRFDDKKQPYPGFKLECGSRTSIWIDIDSLADRMDYTPCYLDGFTSWGVGTYGTALAPGPGANTTPGFLNRNTFYTGMNWNPLPPSPWTGASGSILQYHMGANAGTPPAADSLLGYVTIGVFIGNGLKDSTIKVWKSNYLLNQTNNGGPLRDSAGKIYSWNPADPAGLGLPWTYKNFLLIDQIANKTTPPIVPIPAGWVDDSLPHTYAFNAIINRVPLRRTYDSITFFPDTLYTLEYIDPNWSRCISDTVWYHNFWRIKELNAAFIKSPIEILPSGINGVYPASYLREREDTIWVIYTDSIQDSVKSNVWVWNDQTVTADSFYFSEIDTTDGYYTHGVRRVQYNFDLSSGNPVIIDSTVWPCGVYGTRQFKYPIRFYQRFWDSIGFIAPDILMLRNKCTEPNHDSWSGLYPDTIRIRAQDTTKLPVNYHRFFNYISTAAPDTLVLRSKCPNPNHADPLWSKYGYTNYMDTLFLPMRDTMRFTQYITIDTAMMYLPIWHVYHKTSWEIALKAGLPENAITTIDHFMTNSQNCQYNVGQYFTVGIIDTLHIYGGDWVEDTVFCKNEPAHFIDSLRYWRFDNFITMTAIPIWGTSRPDGYHGFNYGALEPNAGYPWDTYQFDTINFWARDSINPSDTLVNSNTIYSNSQIDFRYFPGKWTNYDDNLTYLPGVDPNLKRTGHWDRVLRGGNVKVLIPASTSDSAYELLYPGMVIFCPVTGPLGDPGLYTWGTYGGWYPCFTPIITFTPLNSPNYDTLNSITDLSRVPIPTIGRTLIYNNGKGAYKKVGMFYWNGFQWVFISNNQYTSFPFYAHRVYWDFGDGTPIISSTKPTHQFLNYGRFKVSMISRDSIGHFDTCVSFVEVMKPVAKIFTTSDIIGCKDTASFMDSSFVITGANDTNTFDHEVSRKWWFTIRYKYPNGLQGQDTLTPNSVTPSPIWFFNKNGIFKVKLAILTEQGCADTVTKSITVQGPRPAFKIFTDTIGCKPFRVGILNMADSFDMRNPSDTPTLSTFFYWGDGGMSPVTGRRDTVWHVYTDTGVFKIYAVGRDALPLNQTACPEVKIPDDSINIYVKQPYYAKIKADKDTVCVGQLFDVRNLSDSLNYLAYRFERRYADSVLTFQAKDSIFGNAALKNQKFDSIGLYKFILFPINYQPSVPKAAQCRMLDTITIRAMKPKAIIYVPFDTTNFPLYKFTNISQAADYYHWLVYQKDGITLRPDADGTKSYTIPNINFEYNLGDDTGSFKVCLVAFTNIPNDPEFCNDTTCVMVNNVYITKVVIPNVFTPDDNGQNDFFKIDVEGELKYDLMVYNRWGTKVFTSTDKTNMWNGKDNNTGADCADGTYFYIFTYKLRAQTNDTSVHGTVTLIRN